MPHIGSLTAFDDLDSDELNDGAGSDGTLFVRPIATRPAMPWDQARAASLDARLNAPLPISELAWTLRRLERWMPGAPGRYAAVYARREDVGDGLETTAELDGQRFAVQFPSPGRRKAQARRLAVAGAIAAVTTALVASMLVSLVTARADANVRLESLEQTVAARLSQTRRQTALQAQAQVMANAGLTNHRADRVLADLAWAARNKSAAAGVERFIWEGSLFAVEVRGEEPPFTAADRPVERSARPVRPGVWLWGVAQGPVNAEPVP